MTGDFFDFTTILEEDDPYDDSVFYDNSPIVKEIPISVKYQNATRFKGKIVKVFYSSATFTTGLIKLADGDKLRFRGKFLVEDGESVTIDGKIINDAKYGEQIDGKSLIYDMPIDSAGLANYLANCPVFKGIGKAKAVKLASLFSENFDEVIKNSPEEIVNTKLLNGEQVALLQEEWLKRDTYNALATWLSAYGLTHNQLQKLIDNYKGNALQVLRANPYELCKLHGFGFGRADDIAMKMGIAKDSEFRIQSCIVQTLKDNEDEGHCWIEECKLVKLVKDKLYIDSKNDDELIKNEMENLRHEFNIDIEEINKNVLVGLADTFETEYSLFDSVKYLGSLSIDLPTTQLQYITDYCADLNESQHTALVMALTYRLSCMCGSAGTGKTYTIKAITDCLRVMGKTFALAAPTGKAAKRITESTRLPASTIHRLLQYNPGLGWQYDADNPLDFDYIIVDESSMIDVDLLAHLFDEIDFSRTQLLLVGDDSQLLPVGVGCPFHDMLQRELCPITRLTQIVRQAGELKENSLAILNGDCASTSSGENGVLRPWYCFAKYEDAGDLRSRLIRFIRDEAQQKLGLNILEDICILSPQNKGDLGVVELNKLLQTVVQDCVYGNKLPQDKRKKFYLGDRIMQTKNDYQIGAMNGETGIIEDVTASIDDNGKPCELLKIRLDNGELLQMLDKSEDIKTFELAYVLSIHKSQGSQYRMVIPIVHSSHAFMLNRNLFYTAVTRAQESCMILGNAKGIRKALADTASAERNTWMSIL